MLLYPPPVSSTVAERVDKTDTGTDITGDEGNSSRIEINRT